MRNEQIHLNFLYDALSKNQGLVLVNGLRQSGMPKSIQQMQIQVSTQLKQKQFSIVKENTQWGFESEVPKMTLSQLQSDSKLRNALFDSDVIYFENIAAFNEFELSLRLCEEGRVVITHFMTPSVMTCLHRIYEFVESDGSREHFIWRFSESLLAMYGQHMIVTDSKETLIAQECYLATPDLKRLLQTMNLKKCEEHMKSPTENSGSMTLNQSLIQMILRRKIDLKKSFEVTRDPSDLDLLLKKVGL